MERKNRILFKVADLRVSVTRIFAVAVLLLVLFTGHSFPDEGLIDISFEISGLLLLSVCSLGRLWALMYISGNKRRRLITVGPYSLVRHPLYLFTFLGIIGIGLASENVLVLALTFTFYLLYYPFAILAEERKLTDKFGQEYLDYMQRTPRFVPRISLYKEPELFEVKTAGFVKNFADGMWFIGMFPILHFIEMLQISGVLPVLLRVP